MSVLSSIAILPLGDVSSIPFRTSLASLSGSSALSSIISLILIFKSSPFNPLKVSDFVAVHQRITREGLSYYYCVYPPRDCHFVSVLRNSSINLFSESILPTHLIEPLIVTNKDFFKLRRLSISVFGLFLLELLSACACIVCKFIS